MRAIIEEMVLWIRDGGLSYKEAVDYAEQTIQGINTGRIERVKDTTIQPPRCGENGVNLCHVTGVSECNRCTPTIPRIEDGFVKEERIGED